MSTMKRSQSDLPLRKDFEWETWNFVVFAFLLQGKNKAWEENSSAKIIFEPTVVSQFQWRSQDQKP